MTKYMATMVENFSDGDIENGMCAPSSFDYLVEANSFDEAEMKANSYWDDAACVFVREAMPEELEEYERMMSEC